MRPKNDARKMEIYSFVNSYISLFGVFPTTEEIGKKMGMAKSTVSKYMTRLREEGFVEKHGRYRTTTREKIPTSRMPVIGEIACGEPILAITEEVEEYLPIDEALLGGGEYFGLIAKGDSMINSGIDDGDIVYVRRQSVPNRDGDIVVAMIPDELTDGYRTTLKRFFRDGNGGYLLRPENEKYEDICLSEVHVVGVAVRVLKNLEPYAKRKK